MGTVATQIVGTVVTSGRGGSTVIVWGCDDAVSSGELGADGTDPGAGEEGSEEATTRSGCCPWAAVSGSGGAGTDTEGTKPRPGAGGWER